MIPVQELYLKVEDTLAKNQCGNFNNDEFNRILASAQEDALDYFLNLDGSSQFVQDALNPFLKLYDVAIAPIVPYPEDYRSKRNARLQVLTMDGDKPKLNAFPANMLETDEDFDSLFSCIRKPNIATEVCSYSFDSEGIHIYPEGVSGRFQMKYIRVPPTATRGVTLDNVNEIEVYDAGTTTNLVWDIAQFNLFHDIICFYMGINIRESEVFAWLSQRKLKNEPQ